MSIETELEQAQAEIVTLKGANATLTADATAHAQLLQEANDAKTAADAEVARLTRDLASVTGNYTIEHARADNLAAEVAQLKAEAKTADQKAAKICAEASVDALQVTAVGDSPAANPNEPMALADFNKLSAFEKMNFCRKGGKLAD